ncbi:MAG: phasin family protein [Xanthobacteraceae bacterium]
MDQKRTVQKGADMAREGIERGTRAAQEGAQAAERSYSAAFDNMRELQMKLFEIAQHNTRIGVELVGDLTSARSPADLVEIWTTYSRKQFDMLSAQGKELAELSQRFATDSLPPLMRSASQAIRGE